MKLYANPGSGSACVEALFAEIEFEYDRVLVNYTENGIEDPKFEKINPRKQIPTLLFDNGSVLTESTAILLYFADRHPESMLAPPPGTFERAKLYQWMSFMLANIYEGELRKNYPHRYVTGDSIDVEESAENYVIENYAILENACSDGTFFFGENFTIMDIYIWMFINWFETYDEILGVCPKIISIAEKVMNRPKIAPVHIANFGSGLGWSPV